LTLSTCFFFFALFTPLTHFFFPFYTRGIPSPNASLYTPSALAISMISFFPLAWHPHESMMVEWWSNRSQAMRTEEYWRQRLEKDKRRL
jgi:hypothetical protein